MDQNPILNIYLSERMWPRNLSRLRILSLALLGCLWSAGAKAQNAVTKAKLITALQNYCIPKAAEDCSNPLLPAYKDQTCYCGNDKYLKYNTVYRMCEVVCPAGKVASKLTQSVCPSGYESLRIKDF